MAVLSGLTLAVGIHVAATLVFLFRILSDFPVLPLFRTPSRALLAPLAFLFLLVPLPQIAFVALLPAYTLAILHYARSSTAQRPHAIFLIASGLSLFPLGVHPVLPGCIVHPASCSQRACRRPRFPCFPARTAQSP